jgi:hypothetical protein
MPTKNGEHATMCRNKKLKIENKNKKTLTI